MSTADKKKARSKKAPKKPKAPVPKDEFDAMDMEQLQEEIKKATVRLAEVRRNRNYYQAERDQVEQSSDIVHTEVEKTTSHIRNIESQMERMQDTHRNDIRIYAQKVIHLEYEHANNIQAVTNLGEQDRNNETIQHQIAREALKLQKMNLKEEVKRADYSNEDEIKRLREIERKECQKLREQFDRNHQELNASYEARLQQLREDAELRKKMEIHEIEERKNRHINDLMINHERNFNEMRNYYNSITQDNLDLIKQLNNEIEDLKVAHLQNEKAMEQIEKKNETLSEPLAQTEAKVKALRHKLANYQKDKVSLRHAKARLVELEETYKNMTLKHEQTMEQYKKLEAERDRLYATFEETVLQVHTRSNAKNVVLEKMLDEYRDVFEVKKQQFTSVLRASNLDPVVLQNVTKKLDDVLSSKNEQISELQYEVAKVTKAHNDLVRVYEAKLNDMRIPKEELSLEPILGQTSAAPADLIVS